MSHHISFWQAGVGGRGSSIKTRTSIGIAAPHTKEVRGPRWLVVLPTAIMCY